VKTDREIFDFIAAQLLEQGMKSQMHRYTNGNIPIVDCAYRGKENTRCAVGMIISDEFYSESLEGKSIHEEGVIESVEKSNPEWDIDDTSFLMLNKLQIIHDTHEPQDWEELFYDCANFTSNGKWSY
jgi:hypothetical protein